MATKAQQVARLVEFLNDPANEEYTVEEVAKHIVNGFYKLLLDKVKEEPPNLRVGVAFKSAVTNKVHHVAWGRDDLCWIITADSRFGYLGSLDPWRPYAMETKAQAGVPGNNVDGWKDGDRVSSFQRSYSYTVIATGDKCVLLQPDHQGRPVSEPNDTMEKHYRREQKPNPMFD